jgi:hypothetical protein
MLYDALSFSVQQMTMIEKNVANCYVWDLFPFFLHFLHNFHEADNISTNNSSWSIDSYWIKYINGAPTFTYLHNNFLHLGKVMKQHAFTLIIENVTTTMIPDFYHKIHHGVYFDNAYIW